MGEFIIKYWIEWLFGIITVALSFVAKYFYNLYKKEKNLQKTKKEQELSEELKQIITENIQGLSLVDNNLQQQIDIIKNGVLSLQKHIFKRECQDLLEDGHKITFSEYESIQEEYSIYHALGGNSIGDTLYQMVSKKADKNLNQ